MGTQIELFALNLTHKLNTSIFSTKPFPSQPQEKNVQLPMFYLLVLPGKGLGIDKMGLGVELLRGEQRVSTSFLFVTTQLISLLRNSSTVCQRKDRICSHKSKITQS